MSEFLISRRFKRLDGRYQRLSISVVASAGAKGVRFLTQLVIVSMSLRYLGIEIYGLWVTVIAGLGWLSWGQAGLAPGLITSIAHAEGSRRQDLAGIYFTTALYVISGVAIVLFCLALIALQFTTPFAPAGSEGQSSQTGLYGLIVVSLGIVLLRFPLGLIESVYVAVQSIAILRIFEVAGQLLSLAAAGLLIAERVSPTLFILGVALAAEFGIALAAIYLVYRLKPGLFPIPKRFSLASSGRLFNLSLGYLLIQVGGYLATQAGILILAAWHGPGSVTQFALTWQLYQMASGVWAMIIVSLWGALAESGARADWRFIDSARRRLFFLSLTLSGIFSFGLALFGPALLRIWSGGRIEADPFFMIAMAIYCALFSWAVLNAQILNAIGAVWKQGMPALLNGGLAMVFALALVPRFGATGLAIALILATAASTAWLLPSMLNRLIKTHVAPA